MSVLKTKAPVSRHDIIKNMMDNGLSYSQSSVAYNVFIESIASGAVNGQKIHLGQVGALTPHIHQPKTVKMSFSRESGGVVDRSTQREYHIDTRLTYKFKLFKKFLQTHQLNWF